MAEFGDLIKGFYDDVKDAAKTATEKTYETVEISKLRIERMKLKGRIQSNYESLGEIVYGGHKNDEDVSDAVNVIFEQLDDDFAKIEEIYEKIEDIKENGILLISSNKSDSELNSLMNNLNKKEILDKHIKVYIANLDELNKKYSLRGKINNIMCMYMLKISGYDKDEIEDFKKLVTKTYISKGQNVI